MQTNFEITNEDFALAIDVNLKGPFVATQEAGRHMRERKRGCILNVASIGGQIGGPKAPHYAAAKAALITFTKSAARLLAPHGVRVNAIAPGFVRTEMIAGVLARDGEANIAREIPLGRIGEPADVAGPRCTSPRTRARSSRGRCCSQRRTVDGVARRSH